MQLQLVKIQLEKQQEVLSKMSPKNPDFMEVVTLRNSLTVDVATIQSRIENLGKSAVLQSYVLPNNI